jgi:hypothetical protein
MEEEERIGEEERGGRSTYHNLNIIDKFMDEYYQVYSIGIFVCKNDTSLYLFFFNHSFSTLIPPVYTNKDFLSVFMDRH